MNPRDPAGGDDRFAPPTAEVADIPAAGAGTLELAGRGARLMAVLLDSLILIIPVVLMLWVVRGSGVFTEAEASLSSKVIDMLLGIAAFIVINGWLLHHEGQTVGKRVLGLRIVAVDGSRVPLARLLALRYGPGFVLTPFEAVYWVWGLADSLAIFQNSRRCLHDLIAGTIVVKV